MASSQEITEYEESIRNLSRNIDYDPWPTGDGVEMNSKIEGVDFCDFWEEIGTYKGFQILMDVGQEDILVSQPDRPCFQTDDGFYRFSKIHWCDRVDVAIVDAQEFIDSFVLLQRNDDPEYDWNVLGRLQLSLPL